MTKTRAKFTELWSKHWASVSEAMAAEDSDKAILLAREAVELARKADDPTLILRSLCFLQVAGGAESEREEQKMLRDSLAAASRCEDAFPAAVLETLDSLSNTYDAAATTKSRERVLLHTLALRERIYGPEHGEVGKNQIALGVCLASRFFALEPNNTRLATRAERAFRRGIAIWEKLDVREPLVPALVRYGALLCQRNRYSEGVELHERVLALSKRYWGNSDLRTARAALNVGMSIHEGRPFLERSIEDAEPFFLQAIAILERKKHSMLGDALRAYAALLRDLGETKKRAAITARAQALINAEPIEAPKEKRKPTKGPAKPKEPRRGLSRVR